MPPRPVLQRRSQRTWVSAQLCPPKAMTTLGKLFISFVSDALLTQRKLKYQFLPIHSFAQDTLNADSVPGGVL